LEIRHLLRRNVHLVAGLRVTALSRLTLPQPEAAEPTQLDLLPTMERIDDALEYGVDDDFRVFLGEVGDSGDFLHELRFGHAAARRIQASLLGCGAPGYRRTMTPSPEHSQLPVPEVIPERRRASSFALLVGFPIGAVLVALQCPDA